MQHLYSKIHNFNLNSIPVKIRKEKKKQHLEKIRFSCDNFFEGLWADKISDA